MTSMLRHNAAASLSSRGLPSGALSAHRPPVPSSHARPCAQPRSATQPPAWHPAHLCGPACRHLGHHARRVALSSSSAAGGSSSSGEGGDVVPPLLVTPIVVETPGVLPPPPAAPAAPKKPNFFGSLFRSLQDYGVGRRALAEGSTGLFIIIGGGFCVALLAWARGQALRTGTPYQATIELPFACGITVGTPLRIRGVQVGTVINVRSTLEKVDVLVEVNDATTIIPRNSLIEANQSGLIAEPLLDVTPVLPIPAFTKGPMEPGCEAEGAVLCENGRMAGHQGVSLDDLVYIMTRMARQADSEGLDKIFDAASAATAAIKEAEPLLQQATKLVEQVTPLLRELREGGLVANLEHMTQAAANAAEDIHRLQSAVMTDENVKALRQTVLTLCRTLEHVESISSDVSVLSRDTGVQRNLKILVQALSRLVDE